MNRKSSSGSRCGLGNFLWHLLSSQPSAEARRKGRQAQGGEGAGAARFPRPSRPRRPRRKGAQPSQLSTKRPGRAADIPSVLHMTKWGGAILCESQPPHSCHGHLFRRSHAFPQLFSACSLRNHIREERCPTGPQSCPVRGPGRRSHSLVLTESPLQNVKMPRKVIPLLRGAATLLWGH